VELRSRGVRCVRWQDLFAARRFLGVSWRVSRANTRGQGKVGGKMGSWDGIEVPGSIAGAAVSFRVIYIIIKINKVAVTEV